MNVEPFPLGTITISEELRERLSQDVIYEHIRRHASGNHGDVDPKLAPYLRELGIYSSSYEVDGVRFYVSTSIDRNATHVRPALAPPGD